MVLGPQYGLMFWMNTLDGLALGVGENDDGILFHHTA